MHLGETAEVYKDVRWALESGIFRKKVPRNSATEIHMLWVYGLELYLGPLDIK
jgi:hypothetical protein